jgi:hypothetical protein
LEESIWFKDLSDLDLEDLVQLKWYIRQGQLADSDWHQKPSSANPEGITMDEWIETLKKEFQRLGI